MARKPDGPPRGAEAARERGAHATPADPPGASSDIPRIDVATLMQGGRQAILLHGTVEYRLQITRAGRLILTK